MPMAMVLSKMTRKQWNGFRSPLSRDMHRHNTTCLYATIMAKVFLKIVTKLHYGYRRLLHKDMRRQR